ncbi:S41 family peptidase [Maribacter aestuarii]|uniref:S41 family peptidase n=1 Tax=Maribacter aestuarii TaxID=1130723 RepID=UPI0025A4F7A8|nr:S41 family peptidase [Maribacter aestuarii]
MIFKKTFVFSLLVGVLAKIGFSQDNSITFQVDDVPEASMDVLGIRGSVAPLSWEKTLFLDNAKITLDFLADVKTVEYKYVWDRDGDIAWEGIDNRTLTFPLGESTITDIWNKEKPVDIISLDAISSENLMKDYALLEEMVLQVHPGTYRYASKEDIKAELQALKAKFKKSRSIGGAYLAMSKVTAVIQCDHTKVGFNNQGRIVNSIIHEQEDKLPFTFKWFDDRMIVGLNASSKNLLKRGTEVMKINGIPVSKIKSELMSYVAADGATDKNRIAKLEVDGFDFRYNAFDVFFPLKFRLKNNQFNILLKHDEKEYKVDVPGMHREQRAKILAERYPEFPYHRDDTWVFEIKDGVGVLTLNSFGLSGWKAMTIDYKEFLATAFVNLKKRNIRKLIIDIRKNAGGLDEMKNELFSYLPFDREKVELFPREGRTRFLLFPEILKPHIKTWGENPWFYNLKNPDARDGVYYVFEEKRENRIPKPAKEAVFEGEVLLLTAPTNTSLAFYTARDFKQFAIGKIVGEETGGNQREINGGQIVFLTLPNSGIEIDFPVMGAFAKKEMPNSGVVPDYLVKTTASDFASDKDAQMQKAMELLND